jgi:ABC-type multidrug transport system fused ATPase/permease subunit
MLIPVLSVLSSDSNLDRPFGITDSNTQRSTVIWIVISIVFFVYVVKNLFLAMSVWIQRGYLTRLTARIASNMLNVYLRQPYKFHLEKNSSTLIRNTQDASRVVSNLF